MSEPQKESPDGLPTGSETTGQQGAQTTEKARNAAPGSPKQGAEPSGYKGDNPATAGSGPTAIHSNTPENRDGKLDPSAPGNAGITPNTAGDKS